MVVGKGVRSTASVQSERGLWRESQPLYIIAAMPKPVSTAIKTSGT